MSDLPIFPVAGFLQPQYVAEYDLLICEDLG